jgi:peptidoglycan/LPS O-acetylase OafA/YrhL
MEKRRALKNVIQFIGLAIILFIVLIPRTLQLGHKWPQVVHSLYLTLTKLFFVIGVSMLVTPSLLGIKNDLVFFLMDTKFFNFIAKISFWTYLIHYMIIEHAIYIQKLDFYYDVADIMTLFVPIAVIAMFFGLVGTVLI